MVSESEADRVQENEEIFENDPEQGLDEICEGEKEKLSGRYRLLCISGIVGGSIFALYVFLLLICSSIQGGIIYQPKTFTKYDEDYVNYFGKNVSIESEYYSRLGGWQMIELETEDGVTLHNFWIHADKKTAGFDSVPATILYLHGNGDRIDYSVSKFIDIHRGYNCNIFMLSYRGYGLSTGAPDEKGIKIDAQTALNWIIENVTEEEKKRLVVYGRSLGGAVAIDLVSKNTEKVNGLIVENSFLSMPALVADLSVFLRPFVCSIHQIFDSATAIQKITVPILFLSAAEDALVPPAHMKKLKELATKSKTSFCEYPKVGHNDVLESFNDIIKFLETIR